MGANLCAVESERDKLMRTIDSTLDVIYSEEGQSLSLSKQQAMIRAKLDTNYDLNVIIRRTIGRNWSRLNADEQTRVLELVKELVLRAYVQGLNGLERPNIQYGKVVQVTDRRIEIDSVITAGADVFNIQYRLARMSSGWQIYDIVAENISVVSNYREQIDDHFRKGTGAELINRLEELLQQDNLDESTSL